MTKKNIPSTSFDKTNHRLSYQDLVELPEKTLKELCQYCGIEFENSMLKFYESERAVFTASVAQVRQSLHKDALDSGKKIEHLMEPFLKHYKDKSQ